MGLIKQLDDEMGRLFDYMEQAGRLQDTMIVFCSDHGDNMGDHWLGEKDLFYDCSARIPLIIYDPRKSADGTRGTVCDKLVEGIDDPRGMFGEKLSVNMHLVSASTNARRASRSARFARRPATE